MYVLLWFKCGARVSCASYTVLVVLLLRCDAGGRRFGGTGMERVLNLRALKHDATLPADFEVRPPARPTEAPSRFVLLFLCSDRVSEVLAGACACCLPARVYIHT